MREDEIRLRVSARLSAARATLPTSTLGRPARLIAGVAQASARSLRRSLRRRLGRDRPDLEPEYALVASLGQLKGVTMKLGQVLGLVDVGLPPRLRTALAALHTHAQPLPIARIRAAIAVELGTRGAELARTLAPEPLCTGSLGQVHRGTLPDGTPVAVKVRHANIAKIVARDFAPAMLTGRLGGWIYPRGRGLVRDLRARVLEECDYPLEAQRQQRFAQLFARHPTIVIPAIRPEWCAPGVLTSTFVDGVHLDEFLAQQPPAEARNRAGVALFDFYLGTLFRQGLYNCDPHPGNYIFMPDGRLALVDFGCVREFEPGFVARLAALTHALLDDDGDGIAHALAALGIATRPADREGLRWLLRAGYGPLLRDETATFDLRAGLTLREVVRRWRRVRGLAISGELMFLLRAFLGVSTVLARLGARANWQRRLQELLDEAPPPPDPTPRGIPFEPLRMAPPAHPAETTRADAEVAARPPASVAPGPTDVAARASGPTDVAARAADAGLFDVVLVDAGASVIAVVRELREITGMELREVKFLVDATPRTIKPGLSRDDAERLQQRLESLGARITLEPTR